MAAAASAVMVASTSASLMASASGPSSSSSRSFRGGHMHCATGLPALRSCTRNGGVRCEAGSDGRPPVISPTEIRESVERATKRELTRDEILQHQETDESEKKSVFGTTPTKGAPYPRPEVERRPETGDRSLASVFAFDGPAPELINGRLAMLGFVWAMVGEKLSGLTVWEQMCNPSSTGLVYFVAVVQLITYASLVPIANGESSDARRWGPFNARAERWNGRLAMIGFAALLIDEAVRQAPLIH